MYYFCIGAACAIPFALPSNALDGGMSTASVFFFAGHRGGAVRRVVGDIHGGIQEKELVKTMGALLMNEIITALEAKYHLLGMIVYGSYADGTNNLNSDFDALLLTDSGSSCTTVP